MNSSSSTKPIHCQILAPRKGHGQFYGPRYRDGDLNAVHGSPGLFQRLFNGRWSPTLFISSGVALMLMSVIAISLSSCGDSGGVTVMMQDYKFVPDTVTVKKGQSVTWTNQDRRSRQVMSGAPPVMTDDFMSPVLEKDQSWSFTFENTGEFPYHDMKIPGITGVVTVEE